MKTSTTIAIIRWTARIVSGIMVAFFAVFFVAEWIGSWGTPSQPMRTNDIINLSLMAVMFIALLLAWKFELAGGLIAIIAFAVNAIINPNILFGIMYIYPTTAILFLAAWGMSKYGSENVLVKYTYVGATVLLLGFVVWKTFFATGFSETVADKSAGDNLSFEVVKNGLPVNWNVYTQKTVGSSADFDFIIDTVDYKEGHQSLKYVVRKCSDVGEWHSPGFCDEFEVEPGATYKVSFWVKNAGSKFEVKVDAVRPSGGAPHKVEIISSSENISDWKQFTVDRFIPSDMTRLRINVNVLSPGTFQIDDIRYELIQSSE